MIQRIQTIYLLVGAALAILLFFYPEVGFKGGIEAIGGGNVMFLYVSIAVKFLIALCCLVTLFLFKNRKIQFTSGRIALFLSIALLFIPLVQVFFLDFEFELLAILNPLVLISVFLALKAIKKDEDLVRSLDRIR